MCYGYPANIDSVITDTINIFNKFEITKADFNKAVEHYKRNLENQKYLPPYILFQSYLTEKTLNQYYTFNELLVEIDNIKYEDMSNARNILNQNFKMDCLITGNCNVNIAKQCYKYFKPFVRAKKGNSKMFYIRNMSIGEEQVFMRKAFNKDDSNSCVSVFYDFGEYDYHIPNNLDYNTTCLLLIREMIAERFFHQLRTIEQNGYIVKALVKNIGLSNSYIIGLLFIIQSDKVNPNVLRFRITTFAKKSLDNISNMSKEEFEKYKGIVIAKLTKPFDNMYDESYYLFSHLVKEDFEFNQLKRIAKIMENISKQEIIDVYNKYIIDKYSRKLRIVELYGRQYLK